MDIEVRRDDLHTTRTVDEPVPDLRDGEALLRVDTFALTTNNVTYAVMGDAMSYWQFFPAADDGWGRVPVWGFADVEASRAPGVEEGQRVYGYLPMSTHLVVTPTRVGAHSFVDAAAHRASLATTYNQYVRAGDDRAREAETALLRPLFATGFLLDDWLADDDGPPAEQVVLASASSKTALGLAFLLHERGDVSVVGLTSPANAAFVESVGSYDRVVPYDRIADDVPNDVATVFVDMAGDGRVLGDVHRHLAQHGSLQRSCMVGATHWERQSAPGDLPGPAPSFFFAPDRVEKRRSDWGPGGLEERLGEAWERFLGSVDGWLEIVERRGPDEARATWLELVDGGAPPRAGFVVSPAG